MNNNNNNATNNSPQLARGHNFSWPLQPAQLSGFASAATSTTPSSNFLLYNPPTLGGQQPPAATSSASAAFMGPTFDNMFGGSSNPAADPTSLLQQQPQPPQQQFAQQQQQQQQQQTMAIRPSAVQFGAANPFAMGMCAPSSAIPGGSTFGSFPNSLAGLSSSTSTTFPCTATAAAAAAFDGLIKNGNNNNNGHNFGIATSMPQLQHNNQTQPQLGAVQQQPSGMPPLMSTICGPSRSSSTAIGQQQQLPASNNSFLQSPNRLAALSAATAATTGGQQQLFDLSNSIASSSSSSSVSAASVLAAATAFGQQQQSQQQQQSLIRQSLRSERSGSFGDAGAQQLKSLATTATTPFGIGGAGMPSFASLAAKQPPSLAASSMGAGGDILKIPKETATIPLERPRGDSTSSSTGGSAAGAADLHRSQSSQQQHSQMSCQVCYLAASNGLHFGARTCAACAAFFRRSISDQKRYICKRSQRCVIRPGEADSAQGYRKMCRNCRMKRCLEIGMLPENVQNKRNKRDFYFVDALNSAILSQQQQQQQQQQQLITTVKDENRDEEDDDEEEEGEGKLRDNQQPQHGGGGGVAKQPQPSQQAMMAAMLEGRPPPAGLPGNSAGIANFQHQQMQQLLCGNSNVNNRHNTQQIQLELSGGGVAGCGATPPATSAVQQPQHPPPMLPGIPWGITLREI